MANVETIRRHRVSLCGTVRDAMTGAGLSGALVELVRRNTSTRTAADGSYFFQDLRTGQYALRVSAPDAAGRYGVVSVTNVAVANDSAGRPIYDARANVQLPPTCVAGRITDAATGAPVSEAVVRIRAGDVRTRSGADGRYGLSPLPPGAPTLEVSARGYAAQARKLSLAAGQELTADFALAKTEP